VRPLDPRETIHQIGTGNMMSISGGRWGTVGKNGQVYSGRGPGEVWKLLLPVGHGYRVEIELAANDTYTVRRVFSRKAPGRRHLPPVDYPKGERTEVYAEEIGQVAYYASCFRSYDETEWPQLNAEVRM